MIDNSTQQFDISMQLLKPSEPIKIEQVYDNKKDKFEAVFENCYYVVTTNLDNEIVIIKQVYK